MASDDQITTRRNKVRFKTLRLLGFFFITPLTALASGQYVIPSLLIDLGLFIVIVTTIFRLQIKWTGKLILFISYITATFLLFYVINQQDALDDRILINIESAVIPPTIVYLTYRLIRNRFKNSDT